MEPLGYDLSDPRLIPSAAAFAEGLIAATRHHYQGQMVMVFGVQPGTLETTEVEVNWRDEFYLALDDPITQGVTLARQGFRSMVWIAGIEPLSQDWLTLRDAVAKGLDLKVIQLSGGLLKGEEDPTPPVVEDLGLLAAIPRLPLIVPCDATEAHAVASWCVSQAGPAYIRLSTMPTPVFTKKFIPFNYGIGGTLTRQGWDITLIGIGPMVGTLVRLIEDLQLDRISPRVINLSTLRPFDRSVIHRAAQDTQRLITVEDHHIATGLGAAVARSMANEPLAYRLRCLGIGDEFISSPPPPDPLHYYRLRSEDILKAIHETIAGAV